jgi:hypothetical protein
MNALAAKNTRGLPNLLTPEMQTQWMLEFLNPKGITWEFGPPARFDQFGNEYVELLLCGPVPSRLNLSECLVTFARSPEGALRKYERVLLNFLGGSRHIVWRIEPEVHQEGSRQRDLYYVYSRLSAYPEKATQRSPVLLESVTGSA